MVVGSTPTPVEVFRLQFRLLVPIWRTVPCLIIGGGVLQNIDFFTLNPVYYDPPPQLYDFLSKIVDFVHFPI